jgi:vacuolar-type H+-ATPase subunit F/Vma7
MMPVKQMGIAVIGDEDLISEMRLAGINRYHLVKGEPDAGEEVRQALSDLIGEPDVSVIVILEDYAEYVGDLLAQVKEGKKIVPVIIEVPSKRGTGYGDAREYYKAYIRSFIGFDIEI